MDFPYSFAFQNLLAGFTFGFEKNLRLSVYACYNKNATFFNISIHQNIIENINEDNKHIKIKRREKGSLTWPISPLSL